jgi:CrcB protein
MLLAGVGGFVGTCARYAVGRWAAWAFHTAWPVGTCVVNIVGCLLIGVLYGLVEQHRLPGAGLSLLLITGFCGGFTTFSTFADDGFRMLQQQRLGAFLLYAGVSLVCGLLMVWLGRGLVKGCCAPGAV